MTTKAKKEKRRDAWEIVKELLQILADAGGVVRLTAAAYQIGFGPSIVKKYVEESRYSVLFNRFRGKGVTAVAINKKGRRALELLTRFEKILGNP